MSTVIKYPGAKWSIADWIINFFPEHHSYLEPFFGSGGVFFNKPRSSIETINDLDGEVINVFECIKNDAERLAWNVFLTPYSRDIFNQSYEKLKTKDNFVRAAMFMARCNMGYGFRTNGERVGWKRDVCGRERAYAAKAWCDLPDIIIDTAKRLKNVQIENKPAVSLIEEFNNPHVLIYCDPPYLPSTRSGRKQYNCEMTEKEHLEMLDVLKNHKGSVLISGYESDLYNHELKNWYKESTKVLDRASNVRKEVLWMNFEPVLQRTMYEHE